MPSLIDFKYLNGGIGVKCNFMYHNSKNLQGVFIDVLQNAMEGLIRTEQDEEAMIKYLIAVDVRLVLTIRFADAHT